MSKRLLEHLKVLIECDTQDPPRDIQASSPIIEYCKSVVGSCDLSIQDHDEGRVSFFAKRGNPTILFNVHLDTVAAGQGWASNPLELSIRDNKAFGRGTCDIKGAAATLLTLFEEGAENIAILFTTDEEGGGGCAVAKFLESNGGRGFRQIVVAEPTACKAVVGHRGFLSIKARFTGTPGHSSEARALNENANHQMIGWSSKVLDMAKAMKKDTNDPASCLNLGIVHGGAKSNVIAGDSFVHLSARLPPGASTDAFIESVKGCRGEGSAVEFEVPFRGEPLPAQDMDASSAEVFCKEQNLEMSPPVDFWTEAALFSAAGLPALVLGPGNIEQAHAIDEWVSLAQLDEAYTIYKGIISNDH